MATQIKLRRDTYQNWYDANPTLALGEPAYDTTNNKLKIGDGLSDWRSLNYLTDASVSIGDVTFSGNTLDSGGGDGFLNLYNGSQVTIGSNSNIPLIVSLNENGVPANWTFGTDGSITFPDSSVQTTAYTGTGFDQSLNTTDNVTFAQVWCPDVRQNTAWTTSPVSVNVPGATPTVVFSVGNWMTSIKLVIAVEGRLDGDVDNVDHTQTCEATIAATYNTAAEPIMSVYGIVYTSPTPLATFTVARNGGNIEVTAVNSQTTNALNVRVQALQFVSRYD